MTVAVCYKCGEFKFGAFTSCPKCKAIPQSEDDFALSLAMTDHYFNRETLEQMAERVKIGDPPKLAPETRANVIGEMREFYANKPEVPGIPRPIKPWWKFW